MRLVPDVDATLTVLAFLEWWWWCCCCWWWLLTEGKTGDALFLSPPPTADLAMPLAMRFLEGADSGIFSWAAAREENCISCESWLEWRASAAPLLRPPSLTVGVKTRSASRFVVVVVVVVAVLLLIVVSWEWCAEAGKGKSGWLGIGGECGHGLSRMSVSNGGTVDVVVMAAVCVSLASGWRGTGPSVSWSSRIGAERGASRAIVASSRAGDLWEATMIGSGSSWTRTAAAAAAARGGGGEGCKGGAAGGASSVTRPAWAGCAGSSRDATGGASRSISILGEAEWGDRQRTETGATPPQRGE
ncbi:hypothetical protein VTK73DRAFT_4522 [Phialemonium thermophilum]|uniref:Uncharacterized protein n=1 Tax=Phialemonium thermophilum TaxID=223376 RepID=A0ABR3V7U7_9PEZI